MGRKHLEDLLVLLPGSAALCHPLTPTLELHAQSELPALVWDPSQPGEGTLRGPWGDSGQVWHPWLWAVAERDEGTVPSLPMAWPFCSPPELPAEGNSPMCQKINGLHVIVDKCLVLQPKKGAAQLWPFPPRVSQLAGDLLLWDPTASALPRPQHSHHCFLAPYSMPGSFLHCNFCLVF